MAGLQNKIVIFTPQLDLMPAYPIKMEENQYKLQLPEARQNPHFEYISFKNYWS